MNGTPRSILIVEDSEATAATLEIALLGIPGAQVTVASSALAAVRLLNEPGAGLDAIVTDLNMPRMDGFELIRHVRADSRFAAKPIIAVSADPDPETPGRVVRLGADAFFAKPYSPTQVRRKLEELLNATP